MGETSLLNALHLSHRQLAVVLEGIADGITALDPTGQLIYGNDAAARLIGYPDAQALTGRVARRHHAQVRDVR